MCNYQNNINFATDLCSRLRVFLRNVIEFDFCFETFCFEVIFIDLESFLNVFTR